MDTYDFQTHTLPSIEMYGGDTVPWEVILTREDGSKFSLDTAAECTCTLSIMPHRVTAGIGVNAMMDAPLLIKIGDVQTTLDGTPAVVFNFVEDDTKELRGKFIYQVEVKHDTDLRICQGHLLIKQNIHR